MMAPGAALAGGGVFAFTAWRDRRARTRTTTLVGGAAELLGPTREADLRTLPDRAVDGIRRYMNERCLNVRTFLDRLYARSFADTLRGLSGPRREERVRALF